MKKLYQFEIKMQSESSLHAEIRVDPDHPVYKGHFPSNPVTPGVIQLQMIRDVLEIHLGKDLLMKAARSIKFTAPHLPNKHGNIDLHVQLKQDSDHNYIVNATLSGGEISYLKFRGEFHEKK